MGLILLSIFCDTNARAQQYLIHLFLIVLHQDVTMRILRYSIDVFSYISFFTWIV